MLIAQITDTHIVPEGECWKGDSKAMTAQRLQSIVRHINNLLDKPDIVIHTGDIVEEGDVFSYRHAKKLLDELDVEYFITCGNHDNFSNLKQVFTEHLYLKDDNFAHYVIDHLPVRIIVLDTRIEGKTYGKLCQLRQKWLVDKLDASDVETVIFLHHFPIRVQDEFFNKINLLEKDSLLNIISTRNNILGLYCGHYHCVASSVFANKLCWVSPSSAPSHLFQNEEFIGLNYSPPSYSLHQYNYDSSITSQVVSVD